MIQIKKDVFFIIKKNQNKIETFGVKRVSLFGSFIR